MIDRAKFNRLEDISAAIAATVQVLSQVAERMATEIPAEHELTSTAHVRDIITDLGILHRELEVLLNEARRDLE